MTDVNNLDFIDSAPFTLGATGLFDLPNNRLVYLESLYITGAAGLLALPNNRFTAIGVPEVAPLRFLMRAYHTVAPIGYVYWTVEQAPDTAGAQAPYPVIELTDIITAHEYPQTES